MTSCPHCADPVTLIAAIEDPAVIPKILAHLGLRNQSPTLFTGPHPRSLSNGLIPSRCRCIPVQFPNRHSPFAQFPIPLGTRDPQVLVAGWNSRLAACGDR